LSFAALLWTTNALPFAQNFRQRLNARLTTARRDDPTRRTTREEPAMPLHFCHPNTPHRKLRMPEWFVSSLMMDRALDAVVRRVKKLDRKHVSQLSATA